MSAPNESKSGTKTTDIRIEKTNVYQKLLELQNELKAPKSLYNTHGKYSYRNCEDILEAVKPLAKKYGLLPLLLDEITYVEGRFYIKAVAKVIDIETKEEISSCAFAREEETKKGMSESQITGSSSSYARKYALNGLYAIDDTKDSDTPDDISEEPDVPKNKKDKKESEEKLTVALAELKAMGSKLMNLGVTKEEIHTIIGKYNGGKPNSADITTTKVCSTVMKEFEVIFNKKKAEENNQ